MNRVAIATLFAVSAAVMLPVAVGQEKPKTKTEEQSETQGRVEKAMPLKLQIVFAEFDGERKVKSLPYMLITSATGSERGQVARLRIGKRVPIYTAKDAAMQYIDTGTNMDSWTSAPTEDGRFEVHLLLELSWVEGDVPVPVEKSGTEQMEKPCVQFSEPAIRQFKSEINLILRDGQTVESTLATDPATGKVIKVAVTLNVVK